MKTWIFLSAHFDDVVLSAGGLAWELTRRGDQVEIWTICAGDPPAGKPLTEYAQLLHGFWDIGEDVPAKRSQEDAACCALLGASAYRRYTMLDNIYRYLPGSDEPVIKVNEDQFRPLEPDVPWTNNATEAAIGRMKMRARTVRGYKSWQGMQTGLLLAASSNF
jgi:LmbE family N-acetylglucosaminyl deacetylase